MRTGVGTRLNPMRSGEIIDTSTQTYQSIGLLLLKAIFVPSLLCFASLAFLFEQVLPRFFVTSSPDNITNQLVEAIAVLAVTVGVGAPLFFIGASYSIALVCQLVSDYMIGVTPSIKGAKRAARSCLWRAVWLSVRQSFLACLGFVAGMLGLISSAFIETTFPGSVWSALITVFAVICLVFGALLMPVVLGMYAIAMPVCLLEGVGVRDAVKRTRYLMRKHSNQPSGYDTIFLLYLVVIFLLVMIFGGFSMAYSLIPVGDWINSFDILARYRTGIEAVLGGIPLLLTLWVLIPVWGTTTTLLYLERRIRLEGYDIETLAKDVWRADRQSRFEL